MNAAVELEWGVRGSFLAYVDRLPDGSARADTGAVREGSVFLFPGERLSTQEYVFSGSVHFFGYAGVLNVSFDDIRVSLADDFGEVSATVDGARVRLAELADPEDIGSETITCKTVTFTDDGTAVLGGVYPPGAHADPVTIRVT